MLFIIINELQNVNINYAPMTYDNYGYKFVTFLHDRKIKITGNNIYSIAKKKSEKNRFLQTSGEIKKILTYAKQCG